MATLDLLAKMREISSWYDNYGALVWKAKDVL